MQRIAAFDWQCRLVNENLKQSTDSDDTQRSVLQIICTTNSLLTGMVGCRWGSEMVDERWGPNSEL